MCVCYLDVDEEELQCVSMSSKCLLSSILLTSALSHKLQRLCEYVQLVANNNTLLAFFQISDFWAVPNNSSACEVFQLDAG